MAQSDILSIQSGIKENTRDMTKYSLFLGGTNVINEALQMYDPLKTGYGRLFITRSPLFLTGGNANMNFAWKNFKHILEYGNTGVSGIGDMSMQTTEVTGGYTGKKFDLPTLFEDQTDTITITTMEFSGSPMRQLLYSWMNGVADSLTGLTHYNGVDRSRMLAAYENSDKQDSSAYIDRIQANQTMEAIYVNTDSTGERVEYACLLANMFPKNLPLDKFNYTSGQHELVDLSLDFAAVKYESIQINQVANALIKKYRILANSLNFYSGYDLSSQDWMGAGAHYDEKTGKLVDGAETDNDDLYTPHKK